MQIGNILLINWPFTDLKGYKRRPAVLLFKNEFDDLLLAFITSQAPIKSPYFISILPNNENRLKEISFIRLDKLITLHQSQAMGVLGRISNQNFLDIKQTLNQFINNLNYN